MKKIEISLQDFDFIELNEITALVIVILIIAFIFYFIRYLLKTFFVPNRTNEIFDDALITFGGKINKFGNPEFKINNKTIILEYDFETGTGGAYEYIIALIDISDIDKSIVGKLSSKFDLIEKNKNNYIQVYTSWGYQGGKFKERIIEKIDTLNSEIIKFQKIEIQE